MRSLSPTLPCSLTILLLISICCLTAWVQIASDDTFSWIVVLDIFAKCDDLELPCFPSDPGGANEDVWLADWFNHAVLVPCERNADSNRSWKL